MSTRATTEPIVESIIAIYYPNNTCTRDVYISIYIFMAVFKEGIQTLLPEIPLYVFFTFVLG